jgi:hypothetical protein
MEAQSGAIPSLGSSCISPLQTIEISGIMNTRAIFCTMAALLTAGSLASSAQSRKARAVKEFMRDKLELSQKLLEALVIEDWDTIVAKGTKLTTMTEHADWRAFENPDYDQQSKLFKQQVDSLVAAAKKKDTDKATLAYVRVTMSCVDCHKSVRGKVIASLSSESFTADSVR